MAHDNQTTKTDATVVDAKPRQKRHSVLIISLVAVAVVAGGGGYIAYLRHQHNVAANNAIAQRGFESTLSTALDSNSDNQTVVYATTNLIDGAKTGKFNINSIQLGQYHIDRATAYMDLNNAQKAIPDFEAAARLNGGLKLPALQGEFQSRYMTGEREQLIPLLQELVQLENNSQNPMRSSEATQYQDDIQAIQRGQEIMF
jgi:tetratricopeptide (TPR) repeat protein